MRSHKVCQRCAKEFHYQPWRVACDRCGNLCVRVEPEVDGYVALYKARARAEADGWHDGVRYTPRGNRSKAVL